LPAKTAGVSGFGLLERVMGMLTDHVCDADFVCSCKALEVGYYTGEAAVLVAVQFLEYGEGAITAVCCAEGYAPCFCILVLVDNRERVTNLHSHEKLNG
jgi:hypothetical protein